MRAEGAAQATAAAGAGVLYAAAQPGLGLWPLAFVALAPLAWAWRGVPLARRVLLGWIAGTVATLLATVAAGTAGAERYYGLAPGAAVLVAVAVGQLFGAGSFALFAALAGDPARHGPLATAVRTGCALAAAELTRCVALTGFPWLLLAYALLPVPGLAQLAAVGGALSVSFLLATTSAAVAEAVGRDRNAAERRRAGLGALAAAGLLAAGAATAPAPDGAGSVHPARGATPPPGALRVLLVQHAPEVERRSAPGDVVGALHALRALTRHSRVSGVELAVWSENALAAVLPENLHLLRGGFPEDRADAALLLGAPRADTRAPGRLHTSAFLVAADGTPLGHHDKVHLLPFAEYVPRPLPRPAPGRPETAPGAAPRVLRLGERGLGPLVCYEVLFADLARRLARDGAGVLVNLSNDAWFGRTGAVEQHLAASMYRAIETRRPLLRATHTGVTGAFDAAGRLVARLPADEPGALAVDVAPGAGATVYARVGELPAVAAALAALGALATDAAARRRAAARPTRPSATHAAVDGSGMGVGGTPKTSWSSPKS
jgi:apolipoprotein N-acyltransferase